MRLLINTKITDDNIWDKRKSNLSHFIKGRLIIPVADAIHLVEYSNILYVVAENNYSRIILKDGHYILSSKTLKYYENCLSHTSFLRVHSGYIVNLDQVNGIDKKDGFGLILDNGMRIPISRTYKNKLFQNLFKPEKIAVDI